MIQLRSFLSVQIVSQLLISARDGIPFKQSDLYKGYQLYFIPPPKKETYNKSISRINKIDTILECFP